MTMWIPPVLCFVFWAGKKRGLCFGCWDLGRETLNVPLFEVGEVKGAIGSGGRKSHFVKFFHEIDCYGVAVTSSCGEFRVRKESQGKKGGANLTDRFA